MGRIPTIMLGAWTLIAAIVLIAGAQYPLDPDARGTIAGTVVHFRSGTPVPRVQVILSPASGGGKPVATTTRKDGSFRFTELPSAYYTLRAQQPGFLPTSFAETEHMRLPFVFGLMPGETLEDIVVRLRPAGVIEGKVEFSDGLPAIGVPVELFREYFFRGRHGFQRTGTARTDDRGAYRLYGLPPGRYYIAAAYSPPPLGAGVEEQLPARQDGQPDNESHVLTYYPSTSRLIEASPVRLRVSEELGNMNVVLATAPAARVRGEVVNGETGEIVRGADLRLRQPSPVADVLVDTPVTVRPLDDGRFELAGVTPGSYMLHARAIDGGEPLTGQTGLTVSGADVENVNITVTPYSELTGKLVTEDPIDFPLTLFRVSLEPHSDAVPAASSSVEEDGYFSLPYVAGETYDIFLLDGPPDAYLESARMGGFELLRTGFRAEGANLPPMTLEFGARGAVVEGEVAESSTKVALGATVALIPNPARIQYFQITTTNAYGVYRFRGVAPGRYTLVAWWDEPPCEIYNIETLEACREGGESIEVETAESLFENLKVEK